MKIARQELQPRLKPQGELFSLAGLRPILGEHPLIAGMSEVNLILISSSDSFECSGSRALVNLQRFHERANSKGWSALHVVNDQTVIPGAYFNFINDIRSFECY